LIGGINSKNALQYLEMGASHVIVTSYVFNEGKIQFDKLREIVEVVGRDRLVLDLSCRRKFSRSGAENEFNEYFVVTNKWTKFTDFSLT